MSNQNTHLDFGSIPYRKFEAMASNVNILGLNALGWHPEVTLESGLKRMIEIERGLV